MSKWKKLSHVIYQCKYHIVWCPKYRYRVLKGNLAKFCEYNIRMLCEWKNSNKNISKLPTIKTKNILEKSFLE